MKVKCNKCGDIINGDKRGTYIMCKCKAIAIDETPYYVRIIGNTEDFEEIKNDKNIKKIEYNKRYYQEHKKELAEKSKNWRDNNKEKIKEHYKQNKEIIYQQQKEYIARNRKKVTKMMLNYRKRKAEEFKEQGQMFCYLSKTEKENRMIAYLCRKAKITEEESRKLLQERQWNIKGILYDLVMKNIDLSKEVKK